MYSRPLVTADFAVPEHLPGPGFHLRMLTIDDVEKDFEAVMASADRLAGLLDPESTWPTGLTFKEELIDLAWHQREFTLRHSFAYTVMSNDESVCLGCAYIFPSCKSGFDAAVYYWVRSGPDVEERDRALGLLVRDWLARDWPFETIAYPGRDISWDEWSGMPSHGIRLRSRSRPSD